MIDLDVVERLSEHLRPTYLEYYGLLPIERTSACVRLASWHEEPDVQALDDLRLLLGAELEVVRAPEEQLRAGIRRVYGAGPLTAEGVIAGFGQGAQVRPIDELALDDLVSLANEAPVIKLVNLLLLEALEARASDVHIEGYADKLRVRYRIDGVLQDAPSPPSHLMPAVISRLKIMADLDIAERRVPQDGRIRLRLQDRPVDVRVATLPTLHGESVVLRLLDKDETRTSLEDLGMAEDMLEAFLRVIARPHGIVLATGPTGSGKTTTLYAAVDRIRTGREKILTVEDPVEYELPGVPQVPVNEKVGVTFATALRALLRQDPDVMLVGEIRDPETAEIATHAALTGHLVLSTLHTNDAASALTRLVDLGVAPYLVASTVQAVLAQRLVRTLCVDCRQPAPMHGAKGCSSCRGSGFRGRMGIYELLIMDADLQAAVMAARPAAALRQIALGGGMRSLRQDGERQVALGRTTPAEVLRVCQE
ncbi:MAG: GspE/PulE family protein [Gemmatimonadales bacterium]